jgi:hypothetical protein
VVLAAEARRLDERLLTTPHRERATQNILQSGASDFNSDCASRDPSTDRSRSKGRPGAGPPIGDSGIPTGPFTGSS